MLGTMNFLTRHALNFLISLTIFTITTLTFDLGVVLVPIMTILTYYVSNKTIKTIQKSKKRKLLDLTRSEYKHIEEQIKQAKSNINLLTQQYVKVRSIK